MIFLDRSVPKSVANALQAVPEDVIWLEDRYSHSAPDVQWLADAGANNWLVITRDKAIRRRPGERSVLRAAGVGCFVLAQRRPMSRWNMLKLLALTLDEMEQIYDAQAKPFIYTVLSGDVVRRMS